MKENNDKLMRQGKGLAAVSVCLIILALLLIVVWADQSFVPQGEDWKEMKTSLEGSFLIKDPNEREKEHSDREIWGLLKDAMVEQGIVPIKSGFLCWTVLHLKWQEEKAEEAYREEQLQLSQETAETIMTVFNDFLSEKNISVSPYQTVDILLRAGMIQLNNFSFDPDTHFAVEGFLGEEEKEELKARLLEVFPDTEKAAAQVFVRDDKCTAAIYAQNVSSNLLEGTDFPYVDENGCFDDERRWGEGWSEVHNKGFVIGYIDIYGVKP